MRKPRPNSYNPAQALHLIANDRNGAPLSCPSCTGEIERSPAEVPPPSSSELTEWNRRFRSLSCSGRQA